MSVMTGRHLEQLRRRTQQEGAVAPAVQEYVLGLKMRVMELEEQLDALSVRLVAASSTQYRPGDDSTLDFRKRMEEKL